MNTTEGEILPLAAPCRQLKLQAPIRWLRLGWRDVRRAPVPSLCFGLLAVLSSYAISAAAYYFGNLGLLLGVMTGFVFLGPLLALTLYSVSDQLQANGNARIGVALRQSLHAAGNAMVFAIVLLIVFLVWARAASMIHIFFPTQGESGSSELVLFLSVGILVGALFAAVVFTASAFSLPMLIDRRTDAVTAILSSVNAVLRNKPVMLAWAALIVFLTVVGFASAFLGFIVILPVLGYATWHGYLETVEAVQWPRQPR